MAGMKGICQGLLVIFGYSHCSAQEAWRSRGGISDTDWRLHGPMQYDRS